MGTSTDDQPASRVVEQPKRSILPYAAAAIVAAVAIWSIQQPNDFEPQRRDDRSAAPAEPPPAATTSAKGDMRTLFSVDDYPADAQRKGEGGTVQAELTIDAQGKVSACRLVRSSGSRSLDAATCNILQRRARFRPARDRNGNAVEDKVVSPPIVWRLEG